ncbi:MAG: hypothetical protein APF80_02195 [Alphaproteobacteria bacterium BRH_c36]|nr:MAG: hypothetical protein APF80_02195 [Alphaproteobacteria bacterium BRH_c36]
MPIATRLLENTELSITQVAEQIGDRSEAAFNQTFKKYVGHTPGNWCRSRGLGVRTANESSQARRS